MDGKVVVGESEEIVMVPGAIHMMIEIHGFAEPNYNEYFCAQLLAAGLIEPCTIPDDTRRFVETARGRFWVDEMLCATPLPEQRWLDPRFQKEQR